MAGNDVPLNDAGRGYYAQQFDSRIKNIRKYGAPPPRASGRGGCLGVGGGGLFALFIIIRLVIGLGAGFSDYSSSSSYNNYNYTPPPTLPNFDPPPDLNDHPWQPNPDWQVPDQPNDPAARPDDPFVLPPDDPALRPDDPQVNPPDDLLKPPAPNGPPAGPDDDKRPDNENGP